LLLVRHASAVAREDWDGDDLARPLDERGLGQAVELVTTLASYEIDGILTSPAVRCIDTVAPLAAARGLTLDEREDLDEEHHGLAGIALLTSLAAQNVVVCGHGGVEFALPDPPPRWRKGAVLVVDADLTVLAVLDP